MKQTELPQDAPENLIDDLYAARNAIDLPRIRHTIEWVAEYFKRAEQSQDDERVSVDEDGSKTFRCPECGSCRELLPNDPMRCFACHYGADRSLDAIADEKLREMIATFRPHDQGGQPVISMHWDLWRRVLAMTTVQALGSAYVLARGEYCGSTDHAYLHGVFSSREKANAANPLYDTDCRADSYKKEHGIEPNMQPYYEVYEIVLDEPLSEDLRLV
jgi:hypothetical protein